MDGSEKFERGRFGKSSAFHRKPNLFNRSLGGVGASHRFGLGWCNLSPASMSGEHGATISIIIIIIILILIKSNTNSFWPLDKVRDVEIKVGYNTLD